MTILIVAQPSIPMFNVNEARKDGKDEALLPKHA
jgi:hypothetical protein